MIIAEHGGSGGVRDSGTVESALVRPRNLAVYRGQGAATLAASWASRKTMGNKRTAWVTARLFLVDNEITLSFDHAEAVQIMEGVADGEITEAELADWFRQNTI